MLNCFKNEKFLCGVCGALTVIVANKIVKAQATRKIAVKGLAGGMKLHADAKAAFRDMMDQAEDICCDAKSEAGIADDEKV